jgi:energy-coupling factor transporter ATP-binding protein EcfA2
MISSLTFTSGYPTRLKGIGRRRLTFNDRINVLFGPNGSGKTTILKTLAAVSGCGRGGWSDGRKAGPLPYGVKVERDDQPVFYQDCYRNSEESFVGADYLDSHAYLRLTGEKRIGLVNELLDDTDRRFLSRKLRPDERPTLLLDEVDNHIGFAPAVAL